MELFSDTSLVRWLRVLLHVLTCSWIGSELIVNTYKYVKINLVLVGCHFNFLKQCYIRIWHILDILSEAGLHFDCLGVKLNLQVFHLTNPIVCTSWSASQFRVANHAVENCSVPEPACSVGSIRMKASWERHLPDLCTHARSRLSQVVCPVLCFAHFSHETRFFIYGVGNGHLCMAPRTPWLSARLLPPVY